MQLRWNQTVRVKLLWTYFPSITIHLSSNVFHWRLETKLVHEYVEYGINNQGSADAGNTEYWGEACKIYFAKHRVCYSLHPELFILHLTKGKLWFAWFLLKHSWNNQFGKLNADNHSNTASDEGKQLKATQKLALHRRFIIDNRILGTF